MERHSIADEECKDSSVLSASPSKEADVKLFCTKPDITVDDVLGFLCEQIVTWVSMCDSAHVTVTHMLKTYPCLYHRAAKLSPLT